MKLGKISGGNQVLGGSVETKFQSVKYKMCGPDELPQHILTNSPPRSTRSISQETPYSMDYMRKSPAVSSSPHLSLVLFRWLVRPQNSKPWRARVLHEATAPQQLQSSTRNTLLLKIVGQHGDDGWPEGLGTATVATPAAASVPLSSRLMPPQYWFAPRFASRVASSS